MSDGDPIWVLTGPTASGKKEVGFEIARRTGAEVIGVDSVKIYRGLTVGSAQPDAAERKGVPLHLVGIADPRDPWNVGRWLAAARVAVAGIRERGNVPLFLGGTPLYLHALLRGFFAGPASDPEIRRRLEAAAAERGAPALHERLALVDPDSARWIGKNDAKRIVRALEVFESAGVPISRLQREGTRRAIEGDLRVVGITASDAILRRRQAERVDAMLAHGLVAEVAALERDGFLVGETARAIGYREILAHLAGKTSLEQARDEIVRDTWELTRKQRKWFKRLSEIRWIVRDDATTTEDLIARVLATFTAA